MPLLVLKFKMALLIVRSEDRVRNYIKYVREMFENLGPLGTNLAKMSAATVFLYTRASATRYLAGLC